ncbi:MAG: extracellular solute-binding protein [Chloroflexi bacterium]|nr:extracellular solute-binding protein [Chloroflexota bacterium]
MSTRSCTTRRHFLALAIVGSAGGALLAACAPAAPPTPTPAPAKPAEKPAAAAPTPAAAPPKAAAEVQLRLHVRTGAEGTKTEMGIEAFQKLNSGITVKLESFPGAEYQDKLLTMGAGGTLGDVAFTHVGFYHQMADGGFWTSLDPLIKAQNYDMSQYYKPGLDHLTWKGNLYALPYKGHTGFSGIWYNKEMLAKENLDPPTPKTYDELVEMAKKLTKGSGGKTDQWGYLYPGHSGWELTGHLRAWGVDPVSPRLGATKAELDQPQQMAAVLWIHDILHKHKVCPLPGSLDYNQIFISGAGAMRGGGLWQSGDTVAIGNRFTMWHASMPKGPAGKIPVFYNHDQMAMSAKGKFQQESFKLLTYMCGKEQGIRLGLAAGGGAATPGMRKDVYESEELAKAVPAMKLYAEHLAQAETHWYAANLQTNKAWTTIKNALDKILLNPNPPKESDFKEANSLVQGVLNEPRL